MRTIQLSHEEIELIQTAIQNTYFEFLKIIEKDRKILTPEIISAILERAHEFDNLRLDIAAGQKDV